MASGGFDSFLIDDDERLSRLLRAARVVAVVGLSGNRSRPSYDVARYLQRAGYRIVPVTPAEREVLGVQAVPDLRGVGEPIDVACMFRRSELVGPHVDEAIAVGAKAVWLQDGVIDVAAARRAHAAGLEVVMDRCMLRDHLRLVDGR